MVSSHITTTINPQDSTDSITLPSTYIALHTRTMTGTHRYTGGQAKRDARPWGHGLCVKKEGERDCVGETINRR